MPSASVLACDAMGEDDDALFADLLDEATNDTDALLAELLGEQPAVVVVSSTEAKHTLEVLSPPATEAAADILHSTTTNQPTTEPDRQATKPIRRNKRKDKETLHSLRVEVSQLTSHLKRLQDDCNIPQHPHVRSAMERATTERLKRRRVEDECRQLRAAVYAQTQFIRGLRSVFSGSAPLSLTAMDLSHYLHNYTRLPRDRSTRWSEYAALAQEARLESAIDILCRETHAMTLVDKGDEEPFRASVESPFIRTEVLQQVESDGFGVTSTSVFAVATTDLSAALRGVGIAARDIMARSQCYECTWLKRQIVDPDVLSGSSSYSNIIVRLSDDNLTIPQELSIEARVVTLSKQTDDYAIVLWDFVDDDELHSSNEATDVTREAVGACFVRREICDDGVERAVCRVMRTRRYRFHTHTSPDVLQRFKSVVTSMMKVSDMIFRGIVFDSIAKEKDAFARALEQLQTVETV